MKSGMCGAHTAVQFTNSSLQEHGVSPGMGGSGKRQVGFLSQQLVLSLTFGCHPHCMCCGILVECVWSTALKANIAIW